MVEYSYNSWGEQTGCAGTLSTALGILNPFRYRGYVYDEETGLYYLQTRYYDPSLCRFISADVFLSTGQGVLGCNAFAYCGNEPIIYHDSNGNESVAVDLLTTWLTGDGSKQEYGDETKIAKKVKKSNEMGKLVNSAIRNCVNGTYTISGSSAFSFEDDTDLYLGSQRFEYSITVTEEIRTRGFWFLKRKQNVTLQLL